MPRPADGVAYRGDERSGLRLSFLSVPAHARHYVERVRADSDGVSIHYELAGTGDALVLIGGLGVHSGEYRPLIDALARYHRVLAADNRGAGSSDKPDKPYSYRMMAADTLATMDTAGVAAADMSASRWAHASPSSCASPTRSGCGP
jgi:alpha-beta hydrolase superfamily lysophospholipase